MFTLVVVLWGSSLGFILMEVLLDRPGGWYEEHYSPVWSFRWSSWMPWFSWVVVVVGSCFILEAIILLWAVVGAGSSMGSSMVVGTIVIVVVRMVVGHDCCRGEGFFIIFRHNSCRGGHPLGSSWGSIIVVFRVLSMRDSWWASLRSLWWLVTIFAF